MPTAPSRGLIVIGREALPQEVPLSFGLMPPSIRNVWVFGSQGGDCKLSRKTQTWPNGWLGMAVAVLPVNFLASVIPAV